MYVVSCKLKVVRCKVGARVGFLIKYVNVVWAVTARMPGLDSLDTWECRLAS